MNARSSTSTALSRRAFLQSVSRRATGVAAVSLALSQQALAQLDVEAGPIRLGMIADLHHDLIHDGMARLDVFLQAMKKEQPDAIIQMGDFAAPADPNQPLIDAFNKAHATRFHVLGNHDIDGDFTAQQVLDAWGMKERYYARTIKGLRIIVLDGNEKPASFDGKYPSYIGADQQEWLSDELQSHQGPVLVLCHQPLAGAWEIDNADEVRHILDRAGDRVLLAINGHSHIDQLLRVGNIGYLHLNSASYVWVGEAFKHSNYPPEIAHAHPRLIYTCPYKDPLFTTLTIDPVKGRIDVQGCSSEWVGPSPAELGRDKHPNLLDGEQIVPKIRARQIQHVVS